MSAIGIIIKNGLGLSRRVKLTSVNAPEAQVKVLTKLLKKAQHTDFGVHYQFSKLLQYDDKVSAFREMVPLHTYETIFEKWWSRALTGEHSVCWPGKVHYWALSSGTSSGSSKHIPVTKAMLKAIQRGSVRQWISLSNCKLPEEFYNKGLLALGGSTSLEYNGIHHAGDLSGITTGKIPFWFQPYYKPGKEIAATKKWQDKLDIITREAHKWDVGTIAGNPAWFQILIERIIEYNKVQNIHEVWPNLEVFTHGAVAFEPYKKSFEALLAHPLIYMETYLASEGFIAYQDRPGSLGMKMLVRNGIYYEFVPFNDQNIDADGNIKPDAKVYAFGELEENKDYVLLMTTCAGAWRYVLGDVIRFVNLKNKEIEISGRTKHYLSMVGEHLSVENMNKAIEHTAADLNIRIKEFTVAGVPYEKLFAHHWFVSTEDSIDKSLIAERIDYHLKTLNDDYAVERGHGIKELFIDIVPNDIFIDFLKDSGKAGAQVKFPRVLKGDNFSAWKSYLSKYTNIDFNYHHK